MSSTTTLSLKDLIKSFSHLKGPVGGECRLRIQSLNPQTHFGEWQCQISSWGEVGSARIRVAKSQAAEIEFVDVWGKVAIDLSERLDLLDDLNA